MPSELIVQTEQHEGLRVTASADGHTVTFDYPPGPQAAGLSPLQGILACLCACSSNSLHFILRRMKQPATSIQVSAHATRRDTHPTVLTDIRLDFTVCGAGVEDSTVGKALKEAEEVLCPVWAMFKPGVRIEAHARVVV